jgi:hypothetical protein
LRLKFVSLNAENADIMQALDAKKNEVKNLEAQKKALSAEYNR